MRYCTLPHNTRTAAPATRACAGLSPCACMSLAPRPARCARREIHASTCSELAQPRGRVRARCPPGPSPAAPGASCGLVRRPAAVTRLSQASRRTAARWGSPAACVATGGWRGPRGCTAPRRRTAQTRRRRRRRRAGAAAGGGGAAPPAARCTRPAAGAASGPSRASAAAARRWLPARACRRTAPQPRAPKARRAYSAGYADIRAGKAVLRSVFRAPREDNGGRKAVNTAEHG